MFSKSSRYEPLPDVITTDVRGHVLESRQLRLPPAVAGEQFHTVKEGDRLDHLAHTYYRQPQRWWRICDANPSFLSPQALLGKGLHRTVRFPIAWDGKAPPWSDMLRSLSQALGVEEVRLGHADQEHPEVQYRNGEALFVVRETAFVQELQELANYLRVGQPAAAHRSAGELVAMLQTTLEAEGLGFEGAVQLVAVEPIRWRIQDMGSGSTYTVQLFGSEAAVRVYESTLHYAWEVMLRYNEMNTSPEELVDCMAESGFEVGRPEEVGRVGKQIAIPLNVTT